MTHISDKMKVLVLLCNVSQQEMKAHLREHKIAHRTIETLFNPHTSVATRHRTLLRVAEAIRSRWGYHPTIENFMSDTIADFELNMKRMRAQFSLPWKSSKGLGDGNYVLFRYAFEDSGRIALDTINIQNEHCTLFYKRASDGLIGEATGTLLDGEYGSFALLTNRIASHPDHFRQRFIQIGADRKSNVSNYFRFGYQVATTPGVFNPCISRFVLMKRDDLTSVGVIKAYANIFLEKEFLSGYKYASAIMEVIKIRSKGFIHEIDLDEGYKILLRSPEVQELIDF